MSLSEYEGGHEAKLAIVPVRALARIRFSADADLIGACRQSHRDPGLDFNPRRTASVVRIVGWTKCRGVQNEKPVVIVHNGLATPGQLKFRISSIAIALRAPAQSRRPEWPRPRWC